MFFPLVGIYCRCTALHLCNNMPVSSGSIMEISSAFVLEENNVLKSKGKHNT